MKNYDTQAVVCLAPDLYRAARAHEAKPRAKGENANIEYSGHNVRRSALYVLGSQHILPEEYRLSTSRLIIVSHCTPDSTQILSGKVRWSPEQLANAVICWLKECVIKRIALKMCYGGGDRGGATRGSEEDLSDFIKRFHVDPRRSFAYEFARRCGFAKTITAQTGHSSTMYSEGFTEPEYDEEQLKTIREDVDGAHQGHAYKIILTPVSGARPGHESNPDVSLVNPTA